MSDTLIGKPIRVLSDRPGTLTIETDHGDAPPDHALRHWRITTGQPGHHGWEVRQMRPSQDGDGNVSESGGWRIHTRLYQ